MHGEEEEHWLSVLDEAELVAAAEVLVVVGGT